MAQIFIGYPIITKTGAILTTSGASADVAIPVNGAGVIPTWIRLSATAACTFRLGAGVQTAITTDCQVQPGDSGIFGVPTGCTHIAAIQVTAAGILNIAPLDNS